MSSVRIKGFQVRQIILTAFTAAMLAYMVGVADHAVTGQGGGQLSAPTGVLATDSIYANKIGIEWNTVRGATNYRIFRSTFDNPETAIDVGTTQANFHFDTGAPAGQQLFYWVRSEASSTVSSMSQSDTGSRAISTQQGPVPPLEPPPPAPPANPLTAAKIELGKILFWDEQLSSTRTVACGTCHIAAKGGSDPRTLPTRAESVNPGPDNAFGTADDILGSPGISLSMSDGTLNWSAVYGVGVQVTARKANSTINAVYSPILFWDGRATPTFRDPISNTILINGGAGLESQAAVPPTSSVEMGHIGENWTDIAARIQGSRPLALSPSVPSPLDEWIAGRSYPELFQEAFGNEEVSPARIIMAIATYERTLFSDQTPFDLATAGIAPLTAQEQRGRGVFNQIACNACHVGNLFTNNGFFYIGVRPQNEDTGRFQVTGNPQNLGQFRAPSLRNAELRGQFMHNGRLQTIEDVIEFYNRGGDFPNAPNFPGALIQPRNLTQGQKADLASFLKRPLTDERAANETGKFARPRLYTESDRVPVVFGTGIPGFAGRVPVVSALSPPITGNPQFTVAVADTVPGAEAVLVINDADPGATGNIPASGTFARIAKAVTTAPTGSGYTSVSIPIPNDPSIVGRTFFGRWYVPDSAAPGGVAVSRVFRFTVFGEAASRTVAFADFDGDGKTDISVYRQSEGNWYINDSNTSSLSVVRFGLAGDRLAPADYDGDGRSDVAVFRGGTWYLLRSSDGFFAMQFGLAGDIPQPADYDGDGKDDIAVFRPADRTWYVLASRDGFSAREFGLSTDRAVAADYDGDGKADVAVYRDGVWYVQQSRDGFKAAQFGISEDKPVIGDYDGDGKSDLAVWRPSTGVWYYLRSSDGAFAAAQFGVSSDVPSPGDYDGDGRADLGIFRPSTGVWYIFANKSGAVTVRHFGMNGDESVPSSRVP